MNVGTKSVALCVRDPCTMFRLADEFMANGWRVVCILWPYYQLDAMNIIMKTLSFNYVLADEDFAARWQHTRPVLTSDRYGRFRHMWE